MAYSTASNRDNLFTWDKIVGTYSISDLQRYGIPPMLQVVLIPPVDLQLSLYGRTGILSTWFLFGDGTEDGTEVWISSDGSNYTFVELAPNGVLQSIMLSTTAGLNYVRVRVKKGLQYSAFTTSTIIIPTIVTNLINANGDNIVNDTNNQIINSNT